MKKILTIITMAILLVGIPMMAADHNAKPAFVIDHNYDWEATCPDDWFVCDVDPYNPQYSISQVLDGVVDLDLLIEKGPDAILINDGVGNFVDHIDEPIKAIVVDGTQGSLGISSGSQIKVENMFKWGLDVKLIILFTNIEDPMGIHQHCVGFLLPDEQNSSGQIYWLFVEPSTCL